MTESEAAARAVPAPRKDTWRRPAWIVSALVIPIVAMLFWPHRWPVSTNAGGREVTPAVLGHFVVPDERSVPRIRDETAYPLRDTLALVADARDIEPRLGEDAAREGYVIVAFLAQVQRTGLCAWHVEFCKYRGLYRQVGVPFLILSAIVLPLWLVFRLFRLRTSGHPPSARRELLLLTAVVYLLGLATLTLTPNRNSRLRAEATAQIELRPNLASLTCSSAPSAANARLFCMQNAAGNVALFFPLGILLPLIWGRLRFWRGMQIAIGLSLGIELIQYLSRALGSYRSADLNDVILNVLGACLGLALMSLMRLGQGLRPALSRA